jgi:hypothetical protein
MGGNNNPTGKGGFGDNPSNINTNGRPPKGYSITEWFREMLNSKPEVKDAIGKSILKKALEGDMAAIRTVWQYMDGMPSQGVDLTSGGEKIDSLVTYRPERADSE